MVAVGVGHRLGAVAGAAPGWLTGLMGWLPGRPTIDAVSHALAATGGVPSVPVHDLAVLAAWAAGGLLAALRLFRWAPRAA